jgi:hypothetical protein
MMKKIIISFLLITMLALVGCAPQSKGEEYIYITHQTYHEWQIWKVAIDGSESEMLYQIPVWISIGSPEWDEYFSDDIKHQWEANDENTTKNIIFKTIIRAKISPDKKMMAIWENAFYFPPANLSFFEQSLMTVIDLETKETIFQYISPLPLSDPCWSSDGVLFAFSQLDEPYRDTLETLHVWDLQAGEEVFSAQGETPKFIGNTHKVFAKYYVENQETGEQDLMCCQVLDPLNGLLEVEPKENIPSYYEPNFVSSDGSKIALDIWDENVYELRIANFEEPDLDTTIISGGTGATIGRISWSHDDKLLAMRVLRNDEPFFEVVDSQSGEVLHSLEENVVSWEWSNQENKIVFVREGIENSCVQKDVGIYILDIQDGAITPIKPPEEIRDYIDSIEQDMICIHFFSGVSW